MSKTIQVKPFTEKKYLFSGSGELVKSELARVTKAVAIDNLTAIATSLSVIKKDLWEIKNTTLQLQDQTSNLQSGEKVLAMI